MTDRYRLYNNCYAILKRLKPVVRGWKPLFDDNCSAVSWYSKSHKNMLVGQPFFDGEINMNLYSMDEYGLNQHLVYHHSLMSEYQNYRIGKISEYKIVELFLNIMSSQIEDIEKNKLKKH